MNAEKKAQWKVAFVVQGRLYGFPVAQALLNLGHDVTLFTSYPAWLVARFGFPAQRVKSFLPYFILVQIVNRIPSVRIRNWAESHLAAFFGRWAARAVPRAANGTPWDVVIGYSGVVKELFETLQGTATLKVMERGSSHIRYQREVLDEEGRRAGTWIDRPSDAMIAREEREYELADQIRVLSQFAYRSFVAKGVPERKLLNIPLGVDRARFVANRSTLDDRKKRLLAGEPLRVVYVGVFSFRKGAIDFEKVVQSVDPKLFQFRFVGQVVSEAQPIADRMKSRAEFVGSLPEADLPAVYRWADLFVLPTVEDGFSMVLIQAMAGGVPAITTQNCYGPDLIAEGKNGWVVPIRRPEEIIQRLQWCHEHRSELSGMVEKTGDAKKVMDWSESVRRLEHAIEHLRENDKTPIAKLIRVP